MATHKGSCGFTLIELVVAIAVIGILTIIAMSSYQSSVMHSRRTDAKTALNDLAAREQRYFSVTNSYTANPEALGYSGSSTAFGSTFLIGSGYYYLNVTNVTAASAGTPASFVATATAVPGSSQARDTGCTTFSVDSLGNYTPTASAAVSPPCWP